MNAKAATCPPEHVLNDFGLGKLDDRGAETVRQHLETCADCRRIAAHMAGKSSVERLGKAHARGSSVSPSLPPAAVQDTAVPGASVSAAAASAGTQVPGIPTQPSARPQTGSTGAAADRAVPPELANNPEYEVIKELARGGMGVVYLARNRIMDRLEVLKVVNKALFARPDALERFQQEIRAAAKLSHPNIVTAYSVLRLGDLLVFAMEYVAGQDLSQVVKRRGALPITNATFYANQVALGLQHAHEKGMVHRDIKPNNLMLAWDKKKHLVKILDFGLAKATREEGADTGLTGSGQMLGTPDYIAPEQTLDAQRADIRADIYSLGCTLYCMLAGSPPFSGNSLYEILLAHHTIEAKRLDLVRSDVPAELADVVAKMMAKDPGQRYQTPIEVARALGPFFKAAPAPIAGPVAPVPSAGSAVTMEWSAEIETKTARWRAQAKPGARPPGVLIAAGVLLIGLLVGLGALFFRFKTADGDSVPTLVEVEPQWRNAAQGVIAAINRRRDELLKGLPTIDIRTLAATSESPARPAPLLSSAQLAKLPQRFVLSGLLGSIREMGNSTWVLLWAGPSFALANYSADPKELPLVVVEFSGVQLAETLADYNANEAVRVVVERQDWGPRSVQPSQNASSPATNDRRQFRRAGGKVVSYWCLKGLAIEKELQSRTCVIPELGRAAVATNSQAVARSLNVVFRRLPTIYGQPFLVAAEYDREHKADGRTWAVLVVRTRSEGQLAMLADMGPTPDGWAPEAFRHRDRVQASMIIRGGAPTSFVNVPFSLDASLSLSSLAFSLSSSAYLGRSSFARQLGTSDNQTDRSRMTDLAPDPLTMWTCIEGVVLKIQRESRPGEGSVSEQLQPPPKKSEKSTAKATDSLLEAPQSIPQPKKTVSEATSTSGATQDASTSSQSLRKTLPIAGQPLRLWKGTAEKPEFDANVLSRVSERMKAFPADDLKSWFSTMGRVTEQTIPFKQLSNVDMLLGIVNPLDETSTFNDSLLYIRFLTERMGVLFDGDKLRPEIATKLLKRLDSLQPRDVTEWRTVCSKVLDKSLSKVFVAGLLLPIDSLYQSDQYSQQKAETLLARLKQLSKDDVEVWKKHVDLFGGTDLDAVLNIAQLDALFEGGQFHAEKLKAIVASSNR